MMGKAKAQQRLIDNLAEEFGKVLSCFAMTQNLSCIISCYTLISLLQTGSKGAPFTSRRFSKCRALPGDPEWLQHR